MKKEYILAFLVLMGFGVVSTMAFSVQDVDSSIQLFNVDNDDSGKISVTSSSIKALGMNIVQYTWVWGVSDASTPDAIIYLTFTTDGGTLDLGPTILNGGDIAYSIDGTPGTVTPTDNGDTILEMHLTAITADDTFMVTLKGTGMAELNYGVFVSIEEGTTITTDLVELKAESEY